MPEDLRWFWTINVTVQSRGNPYRTVTRTVSTVCGAEGSRAPGGQTVATSTWSTLLIDIVVVDVPRPVTRPGADRVCLPHIGAQVR